jgi:hypothetical protein
VARTSELDDLGAALRARHVAVTDLTPPLRHEAAQALEKGRTIYALDDTHWNQHGIAVAAREIDAAWRRLEFEHR